MILGVTSDADIEKYPQSDALDWLCTADAHNFCPDDGFCAAQKRKIMATLYFATEGYRWNNCSQESTGIEYNIVDDKN